MSNQGFCHPHQLDANQQFPGAPELDFFSFDTYPYHYLTNNLEEQCLPDTVFDSFDITPLPTIEWADLENGQVIYPTETAEDSILQTPPAAQRQDTVHSSSGGGEELRQVVLRLLERTERLEKALGNLQNEREEDRERLCREVEKNVKKLEAWNTELKQMVVNLVEELNGGNGEPARC